MDRVNIKDLPVNKPIHEDKGCIVYDIVDNKVAKIIRSSVSKQYEDLRLKYEEKLRDVRCIDIEEIVKPKDIIYCYDKCIGFTMDKIDGVHIDEYIDSIKEASLTELAKFYKNLEDIIIRANKIGIVFPDICTFSHTLVDKEGNIKLIDYDGLQIGHHKSLSLSMNLVDTNKIKNTPKFYENDYYTTELDKRSLATLLFLLVYGVNINDFDICKYLSYQPLKDDIKHVLSDTDSGVYIGNTFMDYATLEDEKKKKVYT